MELISARSPFSSLSQLIDQNVRADYVYMYPPRQTYRPIDPDKAKTLALRSIAQEDGLNVYLHFPFCAQVCAYCNLFVSALRTPDLVEQYVEAIKQEVTQFKEQIFGKRIETIYFGGGTPSLLSPAQLWNVMEAVLGATSCNVNEVPEISLEVSPETVDAVKLREFRDIGINRVNIGMQTADAAELGAIGRSYGPAIALKSIEDATRAGFSNVCVDLIYGLEGQTDESWYASLNAVIRCAPETVCTYALTLRPRTGFASRGYRHVEAETLYRRYDLAREVLLCAGYKQENHVRYIRNEKGGYRQKVNHWQGQNVLGFGAGARSYLKFCDLRNGYSTRRRQAVVQRYVDKMQARLPATTDGFIMDVRERQRKTVILGLFDLSREEFSNEFGIDPFILFSEQFAVLEEMDLINLGEDRIALTAAGARYRDVIAQMFFSEAVSALVHSYQYHE